MAHDLQTTRYAELFDRLAAKNQGAFVPFVTVAHPNINMATTTMDKYFIFLP